MIISNNRTIVLSSAWPYAYRWPISEPDDNLDYSVDFTNLIVNETLSSGSISIAPSAELIATSSSISGNVFTAWLSGGTAGRSYWVKIIVVTSVGRTISLFATLPFDPTLATVPIAPPTNPQYSAPVST